MKSRVQAMDDLLEQGEGVAGYRRCLVEKHAWERELDYQGLTGPGPYFDRHLHTSSGLPAGNVFNDGAIFGGEGGQEYPIFFFMGPDVDLFWKEIDDNDNDSGSYRVVSRMRRPLPMGTYEVYTNDQRPIFFPCNYIPEPYLRWYVHVAAPEGTLHEAFFDPVLDTTSSAVGAGGSDGVLKPASFTFEGVGTITIERIEWGADSVQMELSPHGRLTGHHVDFIEMDGSVGLSLDFEDAMATTTSGGTDALSWTVADSPWADGDTLMLRIYRIVPEFIGSPYVFSLSEDVGLGHAVGSVSATSASDATVTYSITGGNALDSFDIDPQSGAIATTEFLDYETLPSYQLIISAEDSNGGTATMSAAVTVTDVGSELPPTPPDFTVMEVQGGFDMSWRAVPRTSNYVAQWKTNTTDDRFIDITTTMTSVELRPDDGALCNMEYKFRLYSYGDGVSYLANYSAWVDVFVTTAAC